MLPTDNCEANGRTASESPMPEIRLSGSMRGRRAGCFAKRVSPLYARTEEGKKSTRRFRVRLPAPKAIRIQGLQIWGGAGSPRQFR